MKEQANLIEAYHNFLYAIDNAPQNKYPKFNKNNVKEIPNDKLKKIVNNVIEHRLNAILCCKKPYAEIILGYPGGGKTLIENDILAHYDRKIQKIDYDDFRHFDSRALYKSRQHPLIADYMTQIPLAIRDHLIVESSKKSQNVLISAPFFNNFQTMAKSLANRGYKINITYLCAKEELCYLSNLTRYFKARKNNINSSNANFVIPRVIGQAVHHQISVATRHNIDVITEMISQGHNINLKMVDRCNREIPFSDIKDVPQIARHKERAPLNLEEMERLTNELNFISRTIIKVGIDEKEKKIVSDFIKAPFYSNLLLDNIPSKMPLFLDYRNTFQR